jgi:PAS domain-containing protein
MDRNPLRLPLIDVNPAFERYTGLKHSEIIGRKLSEVLSNNEPSWVEIYGSIATNGDPVHSEYYYSPFERYFDVFSYSPSPGQLAVVFMDVTERRRMEEEVRKHRDYLEELVKERTMELEDEIEQRRRAQGALRIARPTSRGPTRSPSSEAGP